MNEELLYPRYFEGFYKPPEMKEPWPHVEAPMEWKSRQAKKERDDEQDLELVMEREAGL